MTTPLLLKVTKFHKAHKVTYVQQKVGTCIEKIYNKSVLIFTFYLKVVSLHIFAIYKIYMPTLFKSLSMSFHS